MFNVNIELYPEEKILHQGGTNHFVGMEAVGGKMFLTNQRLYYKSHGLNLQNHELTMLFSDIQRIEFCRTMYIIPNGLRIYLANGDVEQFVVQRRTKWKRMIEENL